VETALAEAGSANSRAAHTAKPNAANACWPRDCGEDRSRADACIGMMAPHSEKKRPAARPCA